MYVDDLEFIDISRKSLGTLDFKTAVEKITSLKISDYKAKYLYTLFESSNEGAIDIDEKGPIMEALPISR
jgi:hypothetical protein